MSSPTLTAEQIAEYNKIHEDAVAKVLAIKDDPKWELEKEDKDIVFYKRFEESSPFAMIKSIVTIPDSTIEEVGKVLMDIPEIDEKTDSKQRHGFDFSHCVIHGDDYAVVYIATTAPALMVSGRDFILFRKTNVKKDGKEIYINVSIPNTELAPETKKYVRGIMEFQGYIVEQAENQKDVKLTFFVHVDPKGSVPSWAYNKVVTSQGYAAKGIRSKVIRSKQ